MTPNPTLDLTQPHWINRIEIDRLVRQYFWAQGFIEPRTPILVQSPGMEPHIKPIEVISRSKQHKTFLPTSPEFALKKILSKGPTKIFQIAPSFRDEPESPDHHPEFAMLEIYETQITLSAFQDRIQNFIHHLAQQIHGQARFNFRDQIMDWTNQQPWPRFTVNELFIKHAQIDLRQNQSIVDFKKQCLLLQIHTDATDTWNDLYFKIWLNIIEPKLPKNTPCFVSHYPLSQSSLCNPIADDQGFMWANRFELYCGQLELANAFDELRDPVQQRANFTEDQKIRTTTYGDTWPTSPIDEELLSAIAAMPPTCGIAIGLDRLAMFLLNAPNLKTLLALPSHWK